MNEILTKTMRLDYLSLEELRNFQDDIKIITSQDLEKLKKSIKKYNFQFPFLAYKKNDVAFLIDGHQRIKALQSLEAEGFNLPPHFPVVFIPFENDKEAKQAILLFNASYGDFYEKNFKKFAQAIDDKDFLKEIPLPLDKFVADFEKNNLKFSKFKNLSFSIEEMKIENEKEWERISKSPFTANKTIEEMTIQSQEKDIEEENYSITNDLYEKTIDLASKGDVFKLNSHLLFCSSSTDEDFLKNLLKTYEIDMLFTDPPYGIKYNPKSSRRKNVKKISRIYHSEGIMKGDEDLEVFNKFWSALQKIDHNLLILIFGGNYFTDLLKPTNAWAIWDKVQTLENRSDAELVWTNTKNNVKLFKYRYCGVVKENAENQERIGNTWIGRIHPTQKPYPLLKLLIKYYYPNFIKDHYILDTFSGSGSTLIASQELGIRSINVEIDPIYVNRTIMRFFLYCKLNKVKMEFYKNDDIFDYNALLLERDRH